MKEKKSLSVKKKRLFYLAISTALIMSIYFTAVRLNFSPIIHIYSIACSCLLIAYIVMNRGFSRKLPSFEDLPNEWTNAEKEDYLQKRRILRDKSVNLMLFIFPILFTLFLDMIIVSFFAGN